MSAVAETAGTAPAGAAQIPAAKRTTIRDWSTAKLTRTLRLANMCNGAILISTGILCFIIGSVQISFSTVTVASYVVFFGLMLACLECNLSARAFAWQETGAPRAGGARAPLPQPSCLAARGAPSPLTPSPTPPPPPPTPLSPQWRPSSKSTLASCTASRGAPSLSSLLAP